MPKEIRDSLSNPYREFQTAMISGIYLVLHPKGNDAATMHAILDSFMKDHEGVGEMNETTRRELKTIEFLKARGSVAENDLKDASMVVRPAESDPQSDTHHLLGLDVVSSQKPFSSLVNMATPSSSPKTPQSILYWAPPYASPPPASQRLHDVHSSGSGSPTVDDEDFAAQSLLDNWYNAVSNGPTIDRSTLGSGTSWSGLGDADFPGWPGGGTVYSRDQRLPTDVDGLDWSYWETLVNQIQKSP
jgi:hypothetical protein